MRWDIPEWAVGSVTKRGVSTAEISGHQNEVILNPWVEKKVFGLDY